MIRFAPLADAWLHTEGKVISLWPHRYQQIYESVPYFTAGPGNTVSILPDIQ